MQAIADQLNLPRHIIASVSQRAGIGNWPTGGATVKTESNIDTAKIIEIVGIDVYNKDIRFWNNAVLKNNECFEPLTQHGTANGYRMTKRNGGSIMSHRYSYKLFYGAEPVNQACHKCDNRACINPKHLYDGTQSMNLLDAVIKGRNASQKFDLAGVRVLRGEYASGKFTMKDLANKYNVSTSTISNIINFVKWNIL